MLTHVERPFVAIIGGAKVSTKLKILKKLISHVDTILIGGAMAYTFLYSKAISIGFSKFEKDFLPAAFQIMDEASYNKKELILPIDHVVSDKIDYEAKTKIVKAKIPDNLLGGDIGPNTISLYGKYIKSAKTIFWNGPMGVFEIPQFSQGTKKIAKMIAQSKARSVVGGGDSMHAVKLYKVEDKITHVSTGGGATLEFLEKGSLVGLDSIKDSWKSR